jgi:hypothetical protein
MVPKKITIALVDDAGNERQLEDTMATEELIANDAEAPTPLELKPSPKLVPGTGQPVRRKAPRGVAMETKTEKTVTKKMTLTENDIRRTLRLLPDAEIDVYQKDGEWFVTAEWVEKR